MKKTILITAANSDLAFNSIKSLSKNNFLILVSSNTKNLKENFKGKNYLIIQTKNYQYEKIIKILNKKKIYLNAIVHFNGMQVFNSVNNIKKEIFEKIFIANCYTFLEILKITKNPELIKNLYSIVTISSVASSKGNKGISLYSSSKSALDNIVKSAALELSKKKIRVNSIVLGHINKGMGNRVSKFLNSDQIEHLKEQHPLGFGDSKDLYNSINFLIDKHKSRWITGTNLIVDGGYLI